MSAQAAPAPSPRRARGVALRIPALESDWIWAGLLGLALAWVAVKGNGGLRVGSLTAIEIVLDLVAGLIVAAAALAVPGVRRFLPGSVATGFFALFTIFSAISIVWSIVPDASWLEANRLVTYFAVFAAALALVRLAPHRWVALLGGITIASLAVSTWALMHKMFPGWLEPEEIYARLREPFGYWNAVGLMAALGLPGCLWLGGRRDGNQAVGALAYPAVGLLVVVMLLSYSRGTLLAAAVGCAFWFAVVPLRLRGAAVLATGVAGGLAVIAWAFGQDALTKDEVPVALRDQAGHQLLIATVFMALVLLAAGLAISFLRSDRALRPRTRRRIGIALAVAVALIPVGVAAGLATSDRGFAGSISHGWTQLTDPDAPLPANTPGRLGGVGSVRARYWDEALRIFSDHPWVGVGTGSFNIARLRYRKDYLEVQHAHGYVVQVLADRGIVGLVLSLGALAALAVAIALATGLVRGRSREASGAGRRLRTTPERIGLLTLTSVIVVFGVHSFVDWTWFIPGVAIPALLAGGWLAGRGRLELPPRIPTRLARRLRDGLDNRARVTGALAAVVVAAAAAWAAWQPQRAADAGDEALAALAQDPPQIATARRLASLAHRRNPLSIDPYLDEAAIETKARNLPAARRALERAVQLQPGNPVAWTALADFQLHQLHAPRRARRTLAAALYLDPRSAGAIGLLLETNRALTTTETK